jgi:uncharacterized repeat protein (TIGR03803 family)
MTTTEGNTNGRVRKAQITPPRRGAGIILAVFSILFLLGTIAAKRVQAQTFTLLHSFSGSDGATPYAGLVRDSDGNLYGTTYFGGPHVGGTVFKLDTSGVLTVLYSFSGLNNDGADPRAGLVGDSDGNLYGTTVAGGSYGSGTVFKLDTSHTLTVLYSFSGGGDGAQPQAGLVRDSDGNLYGTTVAGGSNGSGTVFKLGTSHTLTVLYSFSGGSDGAHPLAGLVRDSDGNLYGTTPNGGGSGLGAVFKLDTSHTLTVLYSFAGGDGANPYAGLVRDSDGNLYGTTPNGGGSGLGAVFKLDTSHTLTVLHSFSGGTNDGATPYAGLVRDSDGNLYGTTVSGGSSNRGTVFVVSTTPQGAAAVIVTQVNGLLTQGTINKGQDNSLVKKLQNAVSLIIAGKIEGAIGNLEGFINEVNALENSRRLTGEQGSALTSAAQSVIAQLI